MAIIQLNALSTSKKGGTDFTQSKANTKVLVNLIAPDPDSIIPLFSKSVPQPRQSTVLWMPTDVAMKVNETLTRLRNDGRGQRLRLVANIARFKMDEPYVAKNDDGTESAPSQTLTLVVASDHPKKFVVVDAAPWDVSGLSETNPAT
jgi:hypothetical protein